MHCIFTSAILVLGFVSLPSALAGPACSRRLKNQSNCVAECAAKWGWPGAVMGTDRWGSVMAPSQAKSVSEAIASACGTDESSAQGQLAGASSSSSSPSSTATLSFVTLAATSSGCSGSVTTSTVTSISTVTTTLSPASCPVPSSSSSTRPSSSSSSSSSTRSSSSSVTSTNSASTSTSKPTTTVTSTSTVSSSSSSSSTTTSRSTTTTSTVTSTSSTSSPSSTTTASAGTSSADISTYLQYHNTVRAQHGASPLSWNNTLANAAQSWANKCVFQHSGGSLGPYGENLAAGTGSSYGIQQAVQSWTNEASEYNSSNPQPSHFTQVVWKATSQLGCAVASCNGIFPASYGPAKYYVCEYFVQGNVIGQFPQNVQP